MPRSVFLTSSALSAFAFASLFTPRLLAQEDDLEIPANPPGAPAASKPPAPAPASPPAPAAGEQDDLDIPPAGRPAPPQAPPPPPAARAQAPQAPAAVAEPAPPPPTAGEKQAASPAPSRTDAERQAAGGPAIQTGNLERTAHSRPVPLGLLFSGFIQGDFRRNQISEDQLQQDGQPLNRDQFLLRSARLRLDAGYEYTAFALELDATTLNGADVNVRRAEATVLYRGPNRDRLPPLIGLSAGITDLPFGYELVESSRQRLFVERTVASEALFPTQTDVGVKLFGAAGFLRYALAVVNGEPPDNRFLSRDPNAAKDVVGRLGADVRIGDVFGISGGASFAFGKGFHPETPATKDTIFWDDLNGNNVVEPNEEIKGQPGAAARPSSNFERWAIGLDVQAQLTTPLGGTRLFLEGYVAQNHDRALFIADPVREGSDFRHHAWYVGLTQDITRYGIVGFRASYYDPNSDLFEARRGNFAPLSQGILTLSPGIGLVLPDRARLIAQYDFVRDELGRDTAGVPTDAKNDQFTARLQVDL